MIEANINERKTYYVLSYALRFSCICIVENPE